MVLGKSAAERGKRGFLLPEICSGGEISTLTLNVHTQQTSEAEKKKAGMTSSELEAYLRLRLSASSQPTRSERKLQGGRYISKAQHASALT